MSYRLTGRIIAPSIMGAALLASPAAAGPPYVTDDPVPTDEGRWEIFGFTENVFDHGEDDGVAGFDINYGPVEDVQLTATVALDYGASSAEWTDTEIGVKYRFLNDEAHGRQIAVFPKIVLPTAPGPGSVAFQFPVWAQQDFGNWSLFGGGGVTIQHGAGKRDFWEEGIALVNEPREGLAIGIEVAHGGAEEVGEHGATTIDAAANVHLAGPLSLVGAVGPRIEDGTGRTAIRGYLAILGNF